MKFMIGALSLIRSMPFALLIMLQSKLQLIKLKILIAVMPHV